MTREEARAYFIDSNERIISVAKDENGYNYETQQIENVFMRRDFEAKELAIKALEQESYYKDLAESYEKTINKLTKAIAEQEPCKDVPDTNVGKCEDIISRGAVIDLARKGVLVSNDNFESICKAINDIPPSGQIE